MVELFLSLAVLLLTSFAPVTRLPKNPDPRKPPRRDLPPTLESRPTVPKREVGSLLALLTQERMAEVNEAVAFALGLATHPAW